MRKYIIAAFIIGIVFGLFNCASVFGEDMNKDAKLQEAVGKKVLAITSSGSEKLVSVRQVNGNSFEVVSTTSKGTTKKIVSVRQTVGNTYEIKEF